jgi:hypothetical protein
MGSPWVISRRKSHTVKLTCGFRCIRRTISVGGARSYSLGSFWFVNWLLVVLMDVSSGIPLVRMEVTNVVYAVECVVVVMVLL